MQGIPQPGKGSAKEQPSSPAVPSGAPAWTATAGPLEAWLRGVTAFNSTPGYVLIAGALGFGALTRDMGLDIWFGVYTSFVFYALPGQVVLADQIGRGATWVAAALAVSLTAVRLMPMTITLVPLIRDVSRRRMLEMLAVHFIAVTAWVEGHRRLGVMPERLRLWHFLGFGPSFVLCTASGAAAGWLLAGVVPIAISAALLFFTPAYFLLSLLTTARRIDDIAAVGLGAVLGPLVYLVAPSFDLAVAGVVGGSVAYWLGRRA